MNNRIIMIGLIGITTSAYAYRTQKPNVIYIYADDMGKGMLSAYGQKQFTTPNIDRLIAQGTSFDNAYGCMLSAPSRASLMTGYHDCHTDKWSITNGGAYVMDISDTTRICQIEKDIESKEHLLPEGDIYLPQLFKKAGYTTAATGKLEWGFTVSRKAMKEHGWDYYYGYLDHVRCHGYYPKFLFENGTIVKIPGNELINCGKSIEDENEERRRERWDRNGKEIYSEDLFVEKSLEFIQKNKKRPFFLYHASQLPHGPVAIPSIHPEVTNNSELTTIEKEYASMVKKFDESVGKIVQEVERLGIADNTIFIISADNGHEIYYSQKGRCEKPYRNIKTGKPFDNLDDKYYSTLSGDIFNGNMGLAGLKRSNLQGGITIPLIFFGKKIVPSGEKSDALVSNYDFLSTMADMLNIKLESQKDGKSFWPILMKQTKQSKNRYLIFGSNEGPAIINAAGWKLRYYLAKERYELFYLPNDLQERNDIKEEHPEIVEMLKKILLKECNGKLENGINRAG